MQRIKMIEPRHLGCYVGLVMLWLSPSSDAASTGLTWEKTRQERRLSSGQMEAEFQFWFTNRAERAITVTKVNPSCGCTVVKLPLPWIITAGQFGKIPVKMDLRGKHGSVTKTIGVETDAGSHTLTVSAIVPRPASKPTTARSNTTRMANLRSALADRQAVFRNDCAKCHVEPGHGKHGRELYTAVCGICHDSPHRASMVPLLRRTGPELNADYWRQWISPGKPGSLMPAFAESAGGPLTEKQIQSLVRYLIIPFSAPDTQPKEFP